MDDDYMVVLRLMILRLLIVGVSIYGVKKLFSKIGTAIENRKRRKEIKFKQGVDDAYLVWISLVGFPDKKAR